MRFALPQLQRNLPTGQVAVQEVRLLLRASGVDLRHAEPPTATASPTVTESDAVVVQQLAGHVRELFASILARTGADIPVGAAESFARHLLRQTRGGALSLEQLLARHSAPQPCAGVSLVSGALSAQAQLRIDVNAPMATDPPSPGSSSTGLEEPDEAALGRCRMDGASETDSEGALSQAAAAWQSSLLGRVRYAQLRDWPGQSASAAGHPRASGGAQALHMWRVSFASQCEHHMLPFYGTVHIAVCAAAGAPPAGAALVRDIVDLYACRLQVQERITHQVADAMHTACDDAPALVMCDSAHMCMVARGVEKHASATMTTASRGAPARNDALRHSMLEALLAAGSTGAGAL